MKKNNLKSAESNNHILTKVTQLLSEPMDPEIGDLKDVVKRFLKRKQTFLDLAKKYPTPFYVLDSKELIKSIRDFDTAFTKSIPRIHSYFAMKTNYHPYILETIVKSGWGIDVSSRREFDLARAAGSHDILYTGPGKTSEDLLYVLKQDPTVIINMDSFGELERLGEISNQMKTDVKAGIRVYPSVRKTWTKFGIPIADLKKFWTDAKKFPFLKLQGMQFHLSWNENALPYAETLEELASYLKKNFSQNDLATIQYIDFGGGFKPYNTNGIYPWLTPQGSILKTVHTYYDEKIEFPNKYFISPSVPLDTFATKIGEAIRTHLDPILSCNYYTEPGRIISTSSMHIVLKVVDKKDEHTVIMDGGINMVGWERFEYEYFPLINLSRPSLEERDTTLYGSLCDPADLWGYHYYGKSITSEDIVLVPNQGCLTYSLAQNFIQPIPQVHII
jgi:diaminopimelate decarboxylase